MSNQVYIATDANVSGSWVELDAVKLTGYTLIETCVCQCKRG